MGLKLEVGKSYRGVDGNKYGPMECVGSSEHPWNEAGSVSCHVWRCDGTSNWQGDPTLIAEWPADEEPTGPVRTVTRKEIVSGQYGIVKVDADRPTGNPRIIVSAVPTASELRAAIATLTEIADALEEQ